MTAHELVAEMIRYRDNCPNSRRCDAWYDFYEDCTTEVGESPIDILTDDPMLVMDHEFVDYWSAVASGSSPNYDAITGRAL